MALRMSLKAKIYILIAVLIVGVCAFGFWGCSGANDYVHITAMDYKAVLNDNGRVRVTERITFDIHAASADNTFWELWRDLPEEWENGKCLVSFNVLSVKRLTVDNRDSYKEFGQASKLYWDDSDYISKQPGLGPDKWYHSKGPFDDYKNFECLMIYVNGLYRETTVFEIEYEILGTAIKYNDCSELYLPMYSGKAVKYLKDFKAEIRVPQNLMPSKDNYHAWTYGTNSHEIPFIQSSIVNEGLQYETFSFHLDESQLKFKPYNQYIEFSLIAHGQDKHKLTPSAGNRADNKIMYADLLKTQNDYEKLPSKWRNIKIIVLIILLAVAALIVLLTVYGDKKKRKKYNFSKPSVDYDFYREIPSALDANFAGALVFCKHKISDDVKGGYAAAMLGLVRKNYIEVDRINEKRGWTADNTKINVVGAPRPADPFQSQTAAPDSSVQSMLRKELTPTEAAYMNLINRHAGRGTITLMDLQSRVAADYQYTDMFAKGVRASVKTIGQTKGYFKEHDYKRLKRNARSSAIALAVFGVIAMLINFGSYQSRLDLAFGAFFIVGCAFLASALLLMKFSKTYVLLTQLGQDEYSKWRGLYNFLNSETLIKERTVPEVEIWEDYLLYATAFGISEKVMKALKVRFPEYTMSNSMIIRHPFLTSMLFTHMYMRSFRGATRRASMSRATGGGFGGYSSGGRGGGGGGGGH